MYPAAWDAMDASRAVVPTTDCGAERLMPIDFAPERWTAIRDTYRAWWAGELDRPVFQCSLHGRDPGRPEPDIPSYGFTSFYDASVSADHIVDRWDYNLSHMKYIADGFPTVRPVFGPGVMAAFIGADLVNGEGTAWFVPREIQDIAEIEFEYVAGSVWQRRIEDILRAAAHRWQGQVCVGLTDLAAAADVLSTFRPSEALLLDLYDHPEDVKRLTWAIHDLWWGYFADLKRAEGDTSPGYTDWALIYSEAPYSMLQCDFSYMIGPAMFDEFVKPELEAMCKRLTNTFYHLDGPGQLPHLDSLLDMDDLDGIQWIPGAGQPGADKWPDVYRRVRAAGKLVQVYTSQSDRGWEIIDVLADQMGSAEGIVVIGGGSLDDEDRIRRIFERHGCA